MQDPHDGAPPLQFGNELNLLLSLSAGKLVRDAQPQTYIDWISTHGPALAPGLAKRVVDPQGFMRLMGHAMYAALPLPQNHFQPKKLPLPGRNDACLCGSQRKFKQCCELLMTKMPNFPPEVGMPHVLDALGKKAWNTLPEQKAPVSLITGAALQFKDAERLSDMAALLEPWAAQPGRYPAAWADLLDLLADTYFDLNKPRKRKALAQAMVDRGEPAVQSKGWQRLCVLATDAGKRAEARDAFTQAQRCAPEDPALSVLEVSMLLGFGETERAHERSQFHARRLQRMNSDGQWDGLIDTLQEMGQQGLGYLEDAELAHDPVLQRLSQWLAQQPSPQLQVQPRHASAQDMGELAPAKALRQPLTEWNEVFEVEHPMLAGMQGDGGAAWAAFPQWMALLEQHPVLADSFEVLDGLVLALQHQPGIAPQALIRQLTARGLALWSLLRERHPSARCEWAVWPNRPALRLIAQHIADDNTPTAEHSFEWMRALVEVLNPNDNHGFRWLLAAVYLRRGLVAEALALTDRYPGDGDDMTLIRVLALWQAGRRGEATSLLSDLLSSNRELAKVMRSTAKPKPKYTEFVALGSSQAAKITYEEQFDLWQDPALREVLMKVSRPTRG